MTQQQRPIDLVLERVQRPRSSGKGFTALCTGHPDTERSLSIRETDDGAVLLKCFAGCANEDVVRAMGLQMRDLFPERAPAPPRPGRNGHKPRVTLAELASDKALPLGFLRDLGLTDLPDGGVGIPYRDETGAVAHTKRRTALAAKAGSYWPKDTPLMPYGLERLDQAREAGYLIVGEGESDGWTCWFHGLPYLGIPGASAWGVLRLEHLASIERVYMVRETDKAGATFAAGMAQHLRGLGWDGQAFVLDLPAKDPSDLHQQPGGAEDFERLVREAMEQAEPLAGPPASKPEVNRTALVKEIGLTRALAEEILTREHFALDRGGLLYRYANGVYGPRGERRAGRLVKELLETWDMSHQWSSKRADEVVKYIKVDAPELWERPSPSIINLRNGLYDTQTGRFSEHSPRHLSPLQLPVDFDPHATCPAWDRFIASVFPADAQEVAWEIIAWLMIPDTSIQKAILLLGEGSNGKSTFLAAVSAFLGRANTATVSLHKLESDKFAASRLLGKLANICPDLPSAHLAGTSTFKAITGGDAIEAEYKYHDSFTFTPFARLVFSANHPPRSEDASHAFFRRWLAIPFDRTFDEAAGETIPRRELDAQLAAPAELSGVFNKALARLPKVREQGFTESKSMRDAWVEFRATTDPLAVWLDNMTVDHPDAYETKDRLRTAYYAACMQAGRPTLTAKAFGQNMKRLRPNLAEAQRTVAGKVQWCYVGVGLRETPTLPKNGVGASQDSLDSLDSSNCFVNHEVGGNQGGVGERPEASNNNRENPVNPVNPVNGVERERFVL